MSPATAQTREFGRVDDVFIEGSAQFAADGARPHPGAGIGQVHLCGLSRAAELR